MPLHAWLQSETGARLSETLYFEPPLEGILPPFDDLSYHCLRFIDPYANTIFNHRQLIRLVEELTRLRHEARQPAYDEAISSLMALAEGPIEGHHFHHYLRFRGD